MSAPYDETEFIDRDLEVSQAAETASPARPAPAAPGAAAAAPTRAELDAQAAASQDRLAELRRLQEQLEAERAGIEESRRRRIEFEKGREEVLAHLTRGIGLLEKAEFETRRNAEQMARTLADFRANLEAVQSINEDSWSAEDFQVRLTEALTTIENARMEWRSARLKWTLLDGEAAETAAGPAPAPAAGLAELGFWQLCRMGLAFSLPVTIGVLIAAGLLAALLMRS